MNIEAWVSMTDLENALRDTYNDALSDGHGQEAALLKAAALLAVNRDQLAHPALSAGVARLVLGIDVGRFS